VFWIPCERRCSHSFFMRSGCSSAFPMRDWLALCTLLSSVPALMSEYATSTSTWPGSTIGAGICSTVTWPRRINTCFMQSPLVVHRRYAALHNRPIVRGEYDRLEGSDVLALPDSLLPRGAAWNCRQGDLFLPSTLLDVRYLDARSSMEHQ